MIIILNNTYFAYGHGKINDYYILICQKIYLLGDGVVKEFTDIRYGIMVKMSFKLTRSGQAVVLSNHTCSMPSFSVFS